MSQPGVLVIIVLCLFFHVKAQNNSNSDPNNILHPLQPNLVAVIGVFSVVFSLLLLIVAYAKFCPLNPFHFISHISNNNNNAHQQTQTFEELIRSSSRSSGIDRAVIESLPFFRFSSLKGSKEGLECAVCISRFEDSEILRLLPKCRHAFHVKCIDQWLESHSSCPLCRYKFDMRDLRSFSYSNSFRFSGNPSNLTDDPNLEFIVQREQDRQASSRFNIGNSFRNTDKGKKEEELLIQEVNRNHQKLLHKFNHKIIVSDVVIKNRWSDVNASDLLFLNSEMLRAVSSNRISRSNSTSGRFHCDLSMNENRVKIREDIEIKRLYESRFGGIETNNSVSSSSFLSTSYNEANSSEVLNAREKRSMSEIINFARFRDFSLRHKFREASPGSSGRKEERIRRLWLPIVQRTVQWFAGGERNLQELDKKRHDLNV
ncbi:E3 ubiquitin-protein ligase ATL42-like [Pistacia vera]|uniref:E3 ubiquitin-protein ligase ATL42-like n=1 Tax=Pistacia vera TaxID=55513 RepID=UPI0012639B48|nr:E3 ubiquitin-protein ligase ATL42-like [Pistacia vera]